MREEEDLVRASYMAERATVGSVTKLAARFMLETRRRGETFRFALASRGQAKGWSEARDMRPAISWRRLIVAMLPLAGRKQTRSWYGLGEPPLPSEPAEA